MKINDKKQDWVFHEQNENICWLDRNKLNDQWCEIDRETKHEIIGIFINELYDRMAAIEGARELKTIRHHVHGIKGSADNVGAKYLADWARKTEDQCDNASFDTVLNTLKELPEIGEITIIEIKQFVKES